jgi:hypothetical protein
MQPFHFLCKDRKQYASFISQHHRFAELNVAHFLIDNDFIADENLKLAIQRSLAKVNYSINNFTYYTVELINVIPTSKKNNIWYDKEYTVFDINSAFLAFKEFTEDMVVIKHWLNDNQSLLKTITLKEMVNYCHSDVLTNFHTQDIKNTTKREKAIERLLNQDICTLYDFNQVFESENELYLQSFMDNWYSFFDNDNKPYYLVHDNVVDNFYQKKNYALYYFDGQSYGFLKTSTGFCVDISEAKLFASEDMARKYIKKYTLNAAIVQVNLEFNQIIDNTHQVDVSSLEAVSSHIEKKQLENMDTKNQLIEKLLPLLEGEELKILLQAQKTSEPSYSKSKKNKL